MHPILRFITRCCSVGLSMGVLLAQQNQNISSVPPMTRNGITVRVVNGPARPAATVATNAQKAHIDPQTGKLRDATPEESEELNRQARGHAERPAPAAQPVTLPNGLVSLNVGSSFLEFSTARIGADGKVVIACEKESSSHKSAKAKASQGPMKEAADVR